VTAEKIGEKSYWYTFGLTTPKTG